MIQDDVGPKSGQIAEKPRYIAQVGRFTSDTRRMLYSDFNRRFRSELGGSDLGTTSLVRWRHLVLFLCSVSVRQSYNDFDVGLPRDPRRISVVSFFRHVVFRQFGRDLWGREYKRRVLKIERHYCLPGKANRCWEGHWEDVVGFRGCILVILYSFARL